MKQKDESAEKPEQFHIETDLKNNGNGNKPVQFRLELIGEMAERFNTIKKRYGLESNADLVRLLITMEYDKITQGC